MPAKMVVRASNGRGARGRSPGGNGNGNHGGNGNGGNGNGSNGNGTHSEGTNGRAVRGKGRPPGAIVREAAAILEEEIAAGIVAAKKVEERFVNVKELRSGDPSDLVNRFRRDAHDILDIVLDLVQVTVGSAVTLTQNGLPLRLRGAGTNGNGHAALPALTTVAIPGEIAPGGTGEAQISVENDGDSPTGALKFHLGNLVSSSGAVIPASSVTFTPHSAVIEPHSAARIAIAVAVPKGTAPGTYAAIIQTTNLDSLRAMLQIEVAEKRVG
jgi:hypothetical protein